MATDQGPVVQSAILRAELVRLRKESGLTQEDVARTLEWSPSKLIRVEGGHSSITKVDLDALLDRYGVDRGQDRDHLQDLNRGARAPSWWADYRGKVAGAYLNYVGYEAGALSIRQFPGPVIPGLLQTEAYAQVLTASAIAPMEVAPVVELRMKRQSQLALREEAVHQIYMLDEAAIRRQIGRSTDPAIMPAQLEHLAGRAADEFVTIRGPVWSIHVA